MAVNVPFEYQNWNQNYETGFTYLAEPATSGYKYLADIQKTIDELIENLEAVNVRVSALEP